MQKPKGQISWATMQADQHHDLFFTDSRMFIVSIPESSYIYLASFCYCATGFMSDLVRNPDDRFLRNP